MARGSNVIEDYNSYHGIQTTYPSAGMPYEECDKCGQKTACSRQPPWIKLCEPKDENEPSKAKE